MSKMLTDERKNNMLRKKRYYAAHPNETVVDHLKQLETGSDDFIMKKVEEWENTEKK